MKRGVPPTERKARTGEFTPPGMDFCARSNSCSLRFMSLLSFVEQAYQIDGGPPRVLGIEHGTDHRGGMRTGFGDLVNVATPDPADRDHASCRPAFARRAQQFQGGTCGLRLRARWKHRTECECVGAVGHGA